MTSPLRKYNPGFLTDDELVASFCVRETELELLVDALRGCTGSANQHQLVIGPRGSGKTSLLLRVAAEVPRDAELAARCFPIVFAEESYEVGTAGEFWLECLSHLAAQAPPCENDPDLQRTVDELRATRDDQLLADRCLGALLDFADLQDKRLLLIVENLNTLFREMTDRDAGWKLRKILQTEPRIILFASATSRFDEIDHPDRALYDLFQVRTLRPLDTKQCRVLWERVAGRQPLGPTVRSLEILTGGSPRLIAIVARLGDGLSFRELMTDLLDLVDDHTEYFKGHLDSLPAQERRVYLALATLWKPATTREIAEQARLDTSTCSAQLARLAERGVVQVAGGSARRKQYYLTERLYNIYYLLRRRRGPDPLVEALIHFMEAYYSPVELKAIGAGIAREVRSVDEYTQSLCKTMFVRLIELPALAQYRSELLERFALEKAVVECDEEAGRLVASETPDSMSRMARALATKIVLLRELGRLDDALAACEELIGYFQRSAKPALVVHAARSFILKGAVLSLLGRSSEAVAVSDEVLHLYSRAETPELSQPVAEALKIKAVSLIRLERLDSAVEVCDDMLRRFGTVRGSSLIESVAIVLGLKAGVLSTLGRSDEARAAAEEAVRRLDESDSTSASGMREFVLLQKADIELKELRFEAAITTADQLLSQCPASSGNRWKAHVVRARSFLRIGRPSACEPDIDAILTILPKLESLPPDCLATLMAFSVETGPERMLETIQASPSATLLLPLTAALEEDLGRQPRVAQEVAEVARDIRRRLSEWKTEAPSTSGSDAVDQPSQGTAQQNLLDELDATD